MFELKKFLPATSYREVWNNLSHSIVYGVEDHLCYDVGIGVCSSSKVSKAHIYNMSPLVEVVGVGADGVGVEREVPTCIFGI